MLLNHSFAGKHPPFPFPSPGHFRQHQEVMHPHPKSHIATEAGQELCSRLGFLSKSMAYKDLEQHDTTTIQ